jgi:hypothetical protein
MEENWISVKDKLPERYVNVIVCLYGSTVSHTAWIRYDEKGHFWEDAWHDHIEGITDWMPLPKPRMIVDLEHDKTVLTSENERLSAEIEGYKKILKEIEFQVYGDWPDQEKMIFIKMKFPKR